MFQTKPKEDGSQQLSWICAFVSHGDKLYVEKSKSVSVPFSVSLKLSVVFQM